MLQREKIALLVLLNTINTHWPWSKGWVSQLLSARSNWWSLTGYTSPSSAGLETPSIFSQFPQKTLLAQLPVMHDRISSFLQPAESCAQCTNVYAYCKSIHFMLAIKISIFLSWFLEPPTVFLYRLLISPPCMFFLF